MSDWSEDVSLIMNAISMEKSLITRMDANGENRIFDGEILMTMDIRGYRTEEEEILEDAYSPKWDLEFTKKEMDYRNLVSKDSVTCKAGGKFKTNNGDRIFMDESRVYVEDVYINDKGINVEGIINTEVCYHTSEEKDPINSSKYAIPFSKIIETDEIRDGGITEVCVSTVRTECELVSPEEIKIDVEMLLETVTTCNSTKEVIVDVKESAVNSDKIRCMPGLTGYIVQKGDTLWNIAKRYRTTVENIMETNNLTSDEIFPGMRLIIVKLYCY